MNRLGGSELAVGLAISGWLLLSGIVSLASGKFIDRSTVKSRLLILLMAALPLAPSSGLWLMMQTPEWLGVTYGAVPSPLEFTLCAWLTAMPSALLLGVAFNLCVTFVGKGFKASIKSVYLHQALGAAVGGFLTAWLLLEVVSSIGLLWIILAICAVAAIWTALAAGKKENSVAVAAIILLAAGAVLLFELDGAWRLPAGVDPSQIKLVKENRFGVLSLLEDKKETVIFSGSRPLSGNRRPESDEELVLTAHCLNPEARSAAWLGGPLAEPYNLAHKYKFWNRYVYVNPDRDFVDLESRRLNDEPRRPSTLKMEYQDLRGYIREGSERFDIIIVNGGEPDTLATNRLFTSEFFRQAAARLTDRGVLLFFVLEPGNYISEAEGEFLASMAESLHASFRYITILPFSRYVFAASNFPEIKQHAGTIDVELQMIKPVPQYFTHEFVKDKLTNSRMEMLSKALQRATGDGISLNTDAKSTALLQKSLIDASRFGDNYQFLSLWTRQGHYYIYALAALLVLLAMLQPLLSRKKTAAAFPPLTAVALCGTAGIMLEITLMSTYQSRFGELYQMLGAMLAAYMAGLGTGAYAVFRLLEIRPVSPRKSLIAALLLLCGMLASIAFFLHFGILQSDSASTGLFFIVLLFAAAALSGAVFMLASILLNRDDNEKHAFKAGLLAAADHVLPALVSASLSILVLPVIGAVHTTALAAALCLSAAFSNLGK